MLLSGGRLPYIVELEKVSSHQATAKIVKKIAVPPRSRPFIHLALSCPRFSVVESLLKKCVELDTAHFHPFFSELSFIRKSTSLSQKRFERWQSLIKHSMAQSMNTEGMTLHPLVDLKSLLKSYAQSPAVDALFFCEHSGGQSVKEVFSSGKYDSLDHIWVFIGGEGGFTVDEIRLFKSYNINPITLGRQILKVETACLTALALLKYKLGQL